jgi:2-haloacid dehalogenase
VLIDWNPEYVFRHLISDEKEREHFFMNICTHEWNEEQDAGRSLQEATDLLVAQFPDYSELIQAYYGRWEEMLKGSIPETVDILKEIKESGNYRLYALTNWSHETFHVALDRFDFLQWFEGIIVSGEEKTRKPFHEIYQIILDRYKVDPGKALFIDDNFKNIEGAQAVGIRSIHFQNPGQLKQELKKLQVL